jgi:hypothetical protein
MINVAIASIIILFLGWNIYVKSMRPQEDNQ